MEFYAEIDNKTLREIEEDGRDLVLPSGVRMSRKKGSRICYFECDESSVQDLMGFLDDNGISWQETPETWATKKDKKKDKPLKRRVGFGEFIDPWEAKEKSSKKKGGFRDFTENEDN